MTCTFPSTSSVALLKNDCRRHHLVQIIGSERRYISDRFREYRSLVIYSTICGRSRLEHPYSDTRLIQTAAWCGQKVSVWRRPLSICGKVAYLVHAEASIAIHQGHRCSVERSHWRADHVRSVAAMRVSASILGLAPPRFLHILNLTI